MSEVRGITYLDYAATAAVRPDAVIRAVTEYLTTNGATPGRGGHRLAIEADRIALRCRQTLATLLDIPGDPGRIAFFPNATYAINAAMHGVVAQDDRIAVTAFDHNAVLRPAYALAASRAADVVMVPGEPSGALDEDAFDRAIDGARAVVLNVASNVLGTVLDVASLTRRAHAAGALVLLDAAQAAGELPFSVRESGADMVAFTGHKGLLGPHGTGGLWVCDGVDVQPFARGGTGGDSMDRDMPDAYPDHLEAGSQNGAGIAGLAAGAAWLLERDVAVVHAHTSALARRLHEGLASLDGVRVLSPSFPSSLSSASSASQHLRAPVVTCTATDIDPSTLAMRLDREHGVLVRAGLHCAPEVHRMLGTAETGAVRFSAGWASTDADIDRAIRGVEMITRAPAFAGAGKA